MGNSIINGIKNIKAQSHILSSIRLCKSKKQPKIINILNILNTKMLFPNIIRGKVIIKEKRGVKTILKSKYGIFPFKIL